ncbi:DNA gyrase C-terminal beta-propeller domain-containing protein, partial [Marinobacter mobilis]|uniref:DNA gyrase C-terminal beta-propeller domain-containing protein n=1 Tax=Marinobacter mobilis TaxID=488533 RepID=UPI0035C7203A
VFEGEEIMLISNLGTLVRTKAGEVSLLGRNTQGVRLINLRDDEHLVGVQRIVETDEADDGEGDAQEGDAQEGDAQRGDEQESGDSDE